jgi:hypothetical protein
MKVKVDSLQTKVMQSILSLTDYQRMVEKNFTKVKAETIE